MLLLREAGLLDVRPGCEMIRVTLVTVGAGSTLVVVLLELVTTGAIEDVVVRLELMALLEVVITTGVAVVVVEERETATGVNCYRVL